MDRVVVERIEHPFGAGDVAVGHPSPVTMSATRWRSKS